MTERGVSNSKLAREIHVHTSTVSNWLDGKDAKAENLTALCDYFHCSLDYLAGTTLETEKAPTSKGEREMDLSPAFFRLKQGLAPYNLSEADADFLLDVYKAHIRKNSQE